MTVSVKVSVSGDYKVPVTFRQGDRAETQVISGRGLKVPFELYIPFYHGKDIMTIEVGPEEQDLGE